MIWFLTAICIAMSMGLLYVALSLRDAIQERDEFRRLWQAEMEAHDRTHLELLTALRKVQTIPRKPKGTSGDGMRLLTHSGADA